MAPLLRTFAVLLAALAGLTNAVNTVEVRGQDFVDTVTNRRVMILGVDYQPGGQAAISETNTADPLSNGTICLRDAALMQRLGLNTIRVYNVDPTLNHDECASIFNAVGMYMLIDVNSPLAGGSIDRGNPASSYHLDYLNRIFQVVEGFKNYPNTLGFFAANEVMNDVGTARGDNPRYVRAVQRDLKNYIAKQSSRTIPVGYSAADVRDVLQDTWEYLQCAIDGGDDVSRSDFFGLNSYSWCGPTATFQSSRYDELVAIFGNTTIPVFFSEYGCIDPKPRFFNEVQTLYGPQMTALSGGLVYEYTQEPSNYGLVQINENGTATLLADYDSLQGQFDKLNITLIESTNGTAQSLTPPTCSSDLISTSGFSTNFDVPDAPEGLQDLINNGISNPNQGKLVDVTQTAVPMTVYASNGNPITNLAIQPVANGEGNTPSGDNTSGGASTSGGGSATTAGATASPSPNGAATSNLIPSQLTSLALVALAGLLMEL